MGLFSSSPVKKAQKAYEAKMKEAIETQRAGDIQRYAELNEQAALLLEELKALETGP